MTMKRKNLLWLLPVLLTACVQKPQGPDLFAEEAFSSEVDGKAVGLYTLTSPGVVLQATNFGGRVVGLWTRDRNGAWADIVVGHDNLADYVAPPGERFLGACVGPVANRIGGASFEVDGVQYRTPVNDNGRNTLHGGFKGVDNLVWDVVSATDTSLVLHLLHPDGLEGYPGNLDITMTYALTGDSDFTVRYAAVTDAPTPVNLTHHPFFCLRGEGGGSVESYEMEINASHFLPIDALSIPTGEIRPVEGTPFDFRTPHLIGERIGDDDEQLRNARGYDHNWCLDRRSPSGVEFACRVSDPASGRVVEVWTDQPGMQFYSGNFFAGAENGSNGKPLSFRSSLALEAQRYPDAVNHPEFTPSLLRPGETYSQTTVYKFYNQPLPAAWAPAGDHIRTPWADEVSPSNAHPEYPRPQLVRSGWHSLNGLWKYAVTSAGEARPDAFWGDILVPFCLESSLSGVGKRMGPDQALWY